MAVTVAESVAAAETSNGEPTVAPLAGVHTVTVRLLPVGVQVAATAAAEINKSAGSRRRRVRAVTNRASASWSAKLLLFVA